MQRTFAVLFVLVVLVAAIGFYRGWFGVTSHSVADGNEVNVNLRVDKGQIERDAAEVKQEAVDLLVRVKEKTSSGSGETTTPVR